MPKRKPLSERLNIHRLAMKLQTETGGISDSDREIAKQTKLPLWLINELKQAHALYDGVSLDLQLLGVLSFYFQDRRFLSSAIKKIPKARRNRVIFPEENNPVQLRMEKIIRRCLTNNKPCIARNVIAEVASYLPKTTAKYNKTTLQNMVKSIRKNVANSLEKQTQKPE